MRDSQTLAGNQPIDTQEGKAIPVLACPDINVQVAFYQQIGFEVMALQTSPNPFAMVKLGAVELMFYGSRKIVPAENPTMCFIRVNDVDALHDVFAVSLKKLTGSVPRSGIPRFTTVRDLKDDRRFTLTDPGGNTLFIGTPLKSGESAFFRTLEHKQYAKLFTVLYDIVYSKEDPLMAAENLQRYNIDTALLTDLDKAKYLLVVLDIQKKVERPMDDSQISALLKAHKADKGNWPLIRKKYSSIMKKE